jgi:hypothetical protein
VVKSVCHGVLTCASMTLAPIAFSAARATPQCDSYAVAAGGLYQYAGIIHIMTALQQQVCSA